MLWMAASVDYLLTVEYLHVDVFMDLATDLLVDGMVGVHGHGVAMEIS